MEGHSYLDGLEANRVAETFGQRCKRKRIEQQLSLKQLAAAVGIDVNTLASLEADGPLVEYETLRSIANQLQLGEGNLGELIGASFDALDVPKPQREAFFPKKIAQKKETVAELKARNSSSEQPSSTDERPKKPRPAAT